MRAYYFRSDGAHSALVAREVPPPEPGPGRLLVRMRAAAMNRGELLPGVAKAGAEKPAGTEGAGEVVGTGERVMGRTAGGFAEYALMDAREAMPVPESLSWEEAAAVPIVFGVVHDMLIGQGHLAAGEWLLVAGVASGVGVAALQVAKLLGASVIGTSGSPQKLERLKPLGLDLAIATRKGDFRDAVMRATAGRGADLAVNAVGGSVFPECLRSLALEGRLATVGYVDGVTRAEIDLEALHSRRLKLFGVSNKLRSAEGRAESARGVVRDILPAIADGRIRPLLDRVFPFDRLPEAKAYMESDAHAGKIAVRIA